MTGHHVTNRWRLCARDLDNRENGPAPLSHRAVTSQYGAQRYTSPWIFLAASGWQSICSRRECEASWHLLVTATCHRFRPHGVQALVPQWAKCLRASGDYNGRPTCTCATHVPGAKEVRTKCKHVFSVRCFWKLSCTPRTLSNCSEFSCITLYVSTIYSILTRTRHTRTGFAITSRLTFWRRIFFFKF